MIRREDDHAVGGREHRRALRHRDVDARMIRARLAVLVDALRPEQRRDPPGRRPQEGLAPAVASVVIAPRGVDLRDLGGAEPSKSARGHRIFGQASTAARCPRRAARSSACRATLLPSPQRRDQRRDRARHRGRTRSGTRRRARSAPARRRASAASVPGGRGADHQPALDHAALEQRNRRAATARRRAARRGGATTAARRRRLRRGAARRSCQRRSATANPATQRRARFIARASASSASAALGIGFLPRDAPVAQLVERDRSRPIPRRRHDRPGVSTRKPLAI